MTSLARRLWEGVEPIHCMVYFAPEAVNAWRELGLRGYWMGYFASRAAPMGAVSAGTVTSAFYNFAPRMVSRAIPDAWAHATPEDVVATRYSVADAVVQRVLGGVDVEEAASLAARLAGALPVQGRALFGGYAALPWPDGARLRLWHAATLLREFRADGHFAALLTHGIDGCEALVMQVASGRAVREALEPHRGWTAEEWDAAQLRLHSRGLVDAGGTLTDAGVELRARVEAMTDALALPSPSPLSDVELERLVALLGDVRRVVDAAGGVPYPNPMGLAALREH